MDLTSTYHILNNMDRGIKLMLAPTSSDALNTTKFSMMMEIVKLLKSFYLSKSNNKIKKMS